MFENKMCAYYVNDYVKKCFDYYCCCCEKFRNICN